MKKQIFIFTLLQVFVICSVNDSIDNSIQLFRPSPLSNTGSHVIIKHSSTSFSRPRSRRNCAKKRARALSPERAVWRNLKERIAGKQPQPKFLKPDCLNATIRGLLGLEVRDQLRTHFVSGQASQDSSSKIIGSLNLVVRPKALKLLKRFLKDSAIKRDSLINAKSLNVDQLMGNAEIKKALKSIILSHYSLLLREDYLELFNQFQPVKEQYKRYQKQIKKLDKEKQSIKDRLRPLDRELNQYFETDAQTGCETRKKGLSVDQQVRYKAITKQMDAFMTHLQTVNEDYQQLKKLDSDVVKIYRELHDQMRKIEHSVEMKRYYLAIVKQLRSAKPQTASAKKTVPGIKTVLLSEQQKKPKSMQASKTISVTKKQSRKADKGKRGLSVPVVNSQIQTPSGSTTVWWPSWLNF